MADETVAGKSAGASDADDLADFKGVVEAAGHAVALP
jgi:hypothetical protein